MKKDLLTMTLLAKRGLKLFLRDKAGVFFSLMAPMIVLLLYVLFLADVQMSAMEAIIDGVLISKGIRKAFVDGWMLAGALSVACITVSFSAQSISVKDREDGNLADMLVSPVKRGVLAASRLLTNFAITTLICLVVLGVALVYLAISGWYLTVGDVLGLVGLVLLSALSASLISTFVCSFFKSLSAHGAFSGILSAAIGFLVGAYMPLSMFPDGVQYGVLILPGTYSAAVFRHLFMHGALEKIAALSPQSSEQLSKAFAMKLNFFGTTIEAETMLWILAGWIALFAGIYILTSFANRPRAVLSARRKKSS